MILKIFVPKNLAKILAFFAQTAATFCKKRSYWFSKKTQYFRRKLAKKAENCYNIDPRQSVRRQGRARRF
jgi:hypothetical protein